MLLGCRVSLSPVKNRVAVGSESYVVFDADGENGEGDLYLGSASGGKVFRVTYTRVHESSPALSPDGIMLAFIRGSHASDSAGHRVWILNLLNGAERETPELGEGGFPQRLGWSVDGRMIFVKTSRGDYRVNAPPSAPEPTSVDPVLAPVADTMLGVPLGTPILALAQACDSGLCAITTGRSQLLTATGRDALRWGTDSVGYWTGNAIQVRPLGGGTTREVRWSGIPSNPRTASQFPGAALLD